MQTEPKSATIPMQFDCTQEDLIILESLIKSPAYAALKRVIGAYKRVCEDDLIRATESNTVFRTQGRIIGVSVLTNLPELLVNRRQSLMRKAEEERQRYAVEHGPLKDRPPTSPNPPKTGQSRPLRRPPRKSA